MRYLLFFLFIILYGVTYAQWTVLNSGSSEWLRGVHFSSSDTGYVVGDNGTILKTSNEGTTWSTLNSGYPNNLHSVFFTNNTTGWACGDGGIILKTSNGGNTWSNQNTLSGPGLKEIFFLDSLNGYATGAAATCLKTIDGGISWVPLTLSGGVNGNVSLFFNDINTGYIVGLGQADAIMKTNNAGANWTNLHSNSTEEFGSIYFTHPDTGYICTTGAYNKNIIKTTDGGINWNIIHSYSSDGLYSIKFPSSNIGYAVGGFPSYTTILFTSDAGNTWANQNPNTTSALFDCFFVDVSLGFAVGTNGVIIKTLNGGVGIKENLALNLSIYPNPAIDVININTELNIERISILDIMGKTILNSVIENNTINISELSNGVYFVKIYSNNNIITRKFIKQ